MSIDRDSAFEQLLGRIQTRTARCVVLGLGMVGTMHARMLLAAGFSVTGLDTNPSATDAFICQLASGSYASAVKVSTSEAAIAEADLVFVCVRVGIDAGGEPDSKILRSIADAITRQRKEPTLIIVITTVIVGTTTRFSSEWLGSGGKDGWFVASVPERIASQQPFEVAAATPRLVAGVDVASCDLAYALMRMVGATVVRVSSPEVCELSKLLENTFRTQAIALVSEVTRVAHRFGVTATEVCEAAATKPFGYFPFYPGVGVGGHCLPNDLRLLTWSFRNVGTSSPLLYTVADVVENMPGVTVCRMEVLLARPLDGARVLIVGVGFKPGADDSAASPARALMQMLLDCRARVAYLDDHAATVQLRGVNVEPILPADLESQRFDIAVIVSGARTVRLERLYQASGVVLDAGGGRFMEGDTERLVKL